MATAKLNLQEHYQNHLEALWRRAPFVLRVTEWKDYAIPVLVIKERQESPETAAKTPQEAGTFERKARSSLIERGHLTGDAQRRCLPVLRSIVEKVCDAAGIPLELQRFLTHEGLRLRVNLPLDEEAGAKLALIGRLQERINELDRIELIARRVARFTREEAAYWLSRTTGAGADANRWAISGLRLMLGGQPKDKGVQKMLEQLREC